LFSKQTLGEIKHGKVAVSAIDNYVKKNIWSSKSSLSLFHTRNKKIEEKRNIEGWNYDCNVCIHEIIIYWFFLFENVIVRLFDKTNYSNISSPNSLNIILTHFSRTLKMC